MDMRAISDLEACLDDILATNSAAGRELGRALANLLQQLRDGTVASAAAAGELAADIGARGAGAGAEQVAAWAEQADALASGLSADLAPIALPPARDEPPLLTEREDGSPVAPGDFGQEAAANPAPPPSVAAIIQGLDSVVAAFRDQMAALRQPGGDARTQETADAMAASIAELEQLRMALADWMAASAALLDD